MPRFCHEAIGGADDKLACNACMAWHHQACWQEGGRRCASCGGGATGEASGGPAAAPRAGTPPRAAPRPPPLRPGGPRRRLMAAGAMALPLLAVGLLVLNLYEVLGSGSAAAVALGVVAGGALLTYFVADFRRWRGRRRRGRR